MKTPAQDTSDRRQPAGEMPDAGRFAADGGVEGLGHITARAFKACRRIAWQLLSVRVWLLGFGHMLVFVLVYWASFGLRFDLAIPPEEMGRFWQTLPWLLATKMVIFGFSGHFQGWWAYVTFADLAAMIRASAMSLFIIVMIDHFVLLDQQIPRLVLVLDCIGTIVALAATRASWRQFREQISPGIDPKKLRWALLIGTEHSDAILAHQIQSHYQLPYRIKGLLSTNGSGTGSRMGQIPVLGDVDNLCEIAAAAKVTDVLVTAGTLSGKRMRKLMEECQDAGLQLKIIRPLEDRLHGDDRIPIRDIEINDLLRREPVELDTANIGKLLKGRTVMVTGAGGSIGSEICRQVMRFSPAKVVLVGNGENPIFRIERELRALQTPTELRCCIGDVTDEARIRQILESERPEVVFHAAAHKHVPLMELNVGQAVKNNVYGTKVLADLAVEYGVKSFVFISTDKAVHPTSVMGATKHLAEKYIHVLSRDSATKFTAVRFGNVLGSDGSVVPVFQEQIRIGGPITVTDSRMTRFFMTIPEASQLVLQAASMGNGGEIFVLEMGEPVRIVDLARDLIRLSGLPPHAIEITFSGIRPGEKLFEELYFDDERTLPTSHPKVRAAYHRPYSADEVQTAIEDLLQLIHAPERALREKLHEIIPEYVVNGNGGDEAVDDKEEAPAEGHQTTSHE